MVAKLGLPDDKKTEDCWFELPIKEAVHTHDQVFEGVF